MTTTYMQKHSGLLDSLLSSKASPHAAVLADILRRVSLPLSEWEVHKLSVAVSANVKHEMTYCAGNRRHQRQSESAVCLHHSDPGLCHHPAPSPSLLLTLPVAAQHWVGRGYSEMNPRTVSLLLDMQPFA